MNSSSTTSQQENIMSQNGHLYSSTADSKKESKQPIDMGELKSKEEN